ncbi:FadR/GntR family transcriptional regulator [Actinospica sp.]|jgi:DNA-binding FadR family transcriptional regulator|uniref:FadR/GntR family transcriptional regulator n=1 Tax=Actinospica sp. TaxID=1872142 RepID=UPI002BA5C1F1|nr:FadR/GntR family transcriptional regulator [Actinospica sp.]HWG27536.1 FadR/GntR family transcriptional regulator [Actinospica sp.]
MSLYGNRGVHGQTVDAIARRVLSGALPEGATLDLSALQEELGVSLTALRESLKVLAAKGLVDARQKRGTYVRQRADWNLLDPDVLRWQFSAEADAGLLRSLDEVRGIIEPAAVRLAATRRTDDDLARLDAALEAMSSADDSRSAVDADLAFHRALLDATHNELLERMQTVLESALAARDQLVHGTDDASDDPVPSHQAVLDGVRAQDPDTAEAAMRALLDKAISDEERLRSEMERR